MGFSSDLSLGCHTQALSCASTITSLKVSLPELEENQLGRQLHALEDERQKIEAFRRELPLCMQLLEEAIAKLKEQLEEVQPAPGTPQPLQLRCSTPEKFSSPNGNNMLVLKEFMPLKKKQCQSLRREEVGNDLQGDQPVEQPRGIDIGRPALMAEAQLWTQQANSSIRSSRGLLSSKQHSTGAFLPFTRKQVNVPVLSQSDHVTSNGGNLSLSYANPLPGFQAQAFPVAEPELGSIDAGPSPQKLDAPGCMKSGPFSDGVLGAGSTCSAGGSQSHRKARRCWSPDLHQRFVHVLQQLGGSQVATPKQIRELMNVDGLTNDEVKSHLQKYRLHTRRPSPPPQTASAPAPQLVVLGSIWGSDPDYMAGSAAQTAQAVSQSQTSPQGSLQITNQLSGGAGYQDDSGGEDAKPDSAPVGKDRG
ncbi:unnamed protein product [Sphagnum jensenii]|uniref:HTH myb-type domain-containing protein n=1 Tax=Sphagnum jensenii TaxID=128206 RepID=A0ABP0X8D8_9BRYO